MRPDLAAKPPAASFVTRGLRGRRGLSGQRARETAENGAGSWEAGHIFNMLVEHVMDPLAEEWNRKGYGILFSSGDMLLTLVG